MKDRKLTFTTSSLPALLIVLLLPILQLAGEIPTELQNLSYGIYPPSCEYDSSRFNYNKRYNVFPEAIFIPPTKEDVAFVLSMLKKYHLPFALRSGGHCYEPASLSSGYIIDLSAFTEIIADVDTSTAYLGSGCLFENIIPTLGALDYAIPAGTCPTNCINGYTLGGGIGLLSRLYGMGCDSVKSITFLDANSQISVVTAENHPDLFWALLGGGNGSYGIVLGFTYAIYYVPKVSYLKLSFKWDPKTFPAIYEAWQKWVLDLPHEISTILQLYYDSGELFFDITGLKAGAEPFTEWQSAFAKYDPTVFVFEGSYADSSEFWAHQSDLPFLKGRTKIMMKPLSKGGIKQIVEYINLLLKDKPRINEILEFEAYGGKIPQGKTSFFPRQAFGCIFQQTAWKEQTQGAEALAYNTSFYKAISRHTSIYSYANIVDYDLGTNYLKAYYGKNVDRLIKVKRKVDPENLFHWPQSIPLVAPL
jgi:hypothetical protein